MNNLNKLNQLAIKALVNNGCNQQNAQAVADSLTIAEKSGAKSHGFFRLSGYLKSLQSGKVNGKAQPKINKVTNVILQVDGNNCFAPLALDIGIKALVECTKQNGLATMSLVKIHHFSALWVEIEKLTSQGLCAMAFTAFMPSVAPAGSKKPFFGTNPIAFCWSRKDKPAVIFDQATASRVKGDVMIASRDGHTLPLGVGIDADGNDTTDPCYFKWWLPIAVWRLQRVKSFTND